MLRPLDDVTGHGLHAFSDVPRGFPLPAFSGHGNPSTAGHRLA